MPGHINDQSDQDGDQENNSNDFPLISQSLFYPISSIANITLRAQGQYLRSILLTLHFHDFLLILKEFPA